MRQPISGDPQDLYAYRQSNPWSTLDGSNNYQPAFGPKQNQTGAGEVAVW